MSEQRMAVRFHNPFDARLTCEPLEPLRAGELRCKALHSLISSGTERIQYRRKFDPTMHRNSELAAPYCSGYSMAAEVLAVGPGVTGFATGDRIYCTANHMQFFNVKVDGNVIRIPDFISTQEACWMTILQSGMFACMKAQIRHTDTVLILGAGLFGMATLQFAALANPRRIIVVDPVPERAARAQAFGATDVLPCDCTEVFDAIYDMTGGRLCDCVMDCTNDAAPLAAACNLTRTCGQLVVIADPSNSDSWRVASGFRNGVGTGLLGASLNLHGIYIKMMSEDPNPFYPVTLDDVHGTIFEFLRDGKLNVRDLTTHMVNPTDCNAVFDMIYHDKACNLGVVYDWARIEQL